MLKKLFLFAITSGLAKKAFDKVVQSHSRSRVADAKWRPSTPAAAGARRNPTPRT
jgi:hypothetical protein